MRRFLTGQSTQPFDRSAAWACLIANVFVLPGVGTVTAGQRIGYVQAAAALIGFSMTAGWCAWFIAWWIRLGHIPQQVGPYFWICLVGIALFALAWSWALASSIRILLEVRKVTPGKS